MGKNDKSSSVGSSRRWWGLIAIATVLISSKAAAIDKRTEEYDACIKRVSASQGVMKAEAAGGKLGVQEYVLDSCGFRPVLKGASGKERLMPTDCDRLLEWAEQGNCRVDAFAGFQQEYVKQFDPRVFDGRAYEDTCQKMPLRAARARRTYFEVRACTTSPTKKHKRLPGGDSLHRSPKK